MPISPSNPYYGIGSIIHGSTALSGGEVAVSVPTITSHAHVLFTSTQNDHAKIGTIHVHSLTPGVGFSLHSTNIADDSTVTYVVIDFFNGVMP